MRDMPKIESPFIRKDIDRQYVVTPEINTDCAWVFNDPDGRMAKLRRDMFSWWEGARHKE